MIFAIPPLVMVLWLIGGQFLKGARRFGIPGVSIGLGLWTALKDKKRPVKEKWAIAAFLLLIPVLSLGYGENSVFMKVFKKNWIVRVVYAIMLSIPVGIYAFVSGEQWKLLVIVPALIASFQVYAGKLGTIGKSFDILIEDIVRSLTLGAVLVWLLI